jgi:hypothetical protein
MSNKILIFKRHLAMIGKICMVMHDGEDFRGINRG